MQLNDLKLGKRLITGMEGNLLVCLNGNSKSKQNYKSCTASAWIQGIYLRIPFQNKLVR